jgi:hypothetical protein
VPDTGSSDQINDHVLHGDELAEVKAGDHAVMAEGRQSRPWLARSRWTQKLLLSIPRKCHQLPPMLIGSEAKCAKDYKPK